MENLSFALIEKCKVAATSAARTAGDRWIGYEAGKKVLSTANLSSSDWFLGLSLVERAAERGEAHGAEDKREAPQSATDVRE